MITKKYYKLIRVSYEDTTYLTLTNTASSAGLFSVTKTGSPNTTNLEYSVNGVDWVTYDLTELPSIAVPSNGHIYLRGTNASGFNRSYSAYYTLSMTTSFKASGNPFSLRNTDPATFAAYTSVLNDEFYGLFKNSPITDASLLATTHITTVGDGGLENMFGNCTNLLTPPDLSSVTKVTQSGFNSMFTGCSKLTTGPNVSNVTDVNEYYSFRNMFSGCSMLSEVTAPNISSWSTYAFQSWLENAGTQATGTKTVYAPTGLEIPTGASGIPNGWTRVNY